MYGLEDALLANFEPSLFLTLLIGTVAGVVVGAVPGLNGAMLIALCLPLTYGMESLHAITLLTAMYVGGVSGGLISATLLKIPGAPAAIMTTLDGYPMAKAGQAGRAIGIGIIASFVGGLISWFFLAGFSPPLARLAVIFGPFEYFALVLMALVLISSMGGKSMWRGLLAGFFGMLVATPGADPASGIIRLDGGIPELQAGFGLLPVLLGVFAISQLLSDVERMELIPEKVSSRFSGMRRAIADVIGQPVNLLRSSLVGTWIGILPGVGAAIGSIVSYTAAKNFSGGRVKFGTGVPEGIVASEAANNANVNGALIPLITLGIPGSNIDAILLGALLLHDLAPGPLLFVNNPEIAYGFISAALVANFVMLFFMIGAVRWMSRLIDAPRALLVPVVAVFCVVGAFSAANSIFDVFVMILFGVVGYAMNKHGLPTGPFVIGYVLAPIAETQLRSGLMISDGSLMPLVSRPISLACLIIALVLLFMPTVRRAAKNRLARKEDSGDAARGS